MYIDVQSTCVYCIVGYPLQRAVAAKKGLENPNEIIHPKSRFPLLSFMLPICIWKYTWVRAPVSPQLRTVPMRGGITEAPNNAQMLTQEASEVNGNILLLEPALLSRLTTLHFILSLTGSSQGHGP